MQITYGSENVVDIRSGSASTLVTLADTAPARVAWEPLDKRAMDVEVRVSYQQMTGLPLNVVGLGAPLIRYSTALSHGSSVIVEPPPTFPLQPGTHAAFGDKVPRSLPSLLPGRGMQFRVTTREFSITLQNTGFLGAGYKLKQLYGDYLEELGQPDVGTFPSVTIAVSFQPVEGLEVSVVPRYAAINPRSVADDWGDYAPFPPSATEWRVLDKRGQRVNLGYDYTVDDYDTAQKNARVSIHTLDPIGAEIAAFLPPLLFDWTPIPLAAFALCRVIKMPGDADYGYLMQEPFNVEFR